MDSFSGIEFDIVKRYVPRDCFVRIFFGGIYWFENKGDVATYINTLLDSEKCSKPFVAVVGIGGVGKTTVLRKLYLDLIEAGWIPILIRSSFEKKVKAILLGDKPVIEIYIDFADDQLRFTTFLSAVYVLAKELKGIIRDGLTDKEIDEVVELIEKKFNIPIKHEERIRFIDSLKEKIFETKDILEIAGFTGIVFSSGFIAPVIGAVFGFQFLEHLIRRGHGVKSIAQLLDRIEKEKIGKIAILIDDAHELKNLVRRLVIELSRTGCSRIRNKLAIVLSYRIEEDKEAFDKIIYGSIKNIFGFDEIKYIAPYVQLIYLFPAVNQFKEILRANWREEYDKVCNLWDDWEYLGKATMWLPKLGIIMLQLALELNKNVRDLIQEIMLEGIEYPGEYMPIHRGMSLEEILDSTKINIGYIQSYIRAIYEKLYEKYGPLFTALTLIGAPITIDVLKEFLASYGLSEEEIDKRIHLLRRARTIVKVDKIKQGDSIKETFSLRDLLKEQLETLEVIEDFDTDLMLERNKVAWKLLNAATTYARKSGRYAFFTLINAIYLLTRITDSFLNGDWPEDIGEDEILETIKYIEKEYQLLQYILFWGKNSIQYPNIIDSSIILLQSIIEEIFGDDTEYELFHVYIIEKYGEREWLKLLIRIFDTIKGLTICKASTSPSLIEYLHTTLFDLRELFYSISNRVETEIFNEPAVFIAYISAYTYLLSSMFSRIFFLPELSSNIFFTSSLRDYFEQLPKILQRCSNLINSEGVLAFSLLGIEQNMLVEMIKYDKLLVNLVKDSIKWLEVNKEYPTDNNLILYLESLEITRKRWSIFRAQMLAIAYSVLGRYYVDTGQLDKAEEFFSKSWKILWMSKHELSPCEINIVLYEWTWYIRSLFLNHGYKTLNQLIEYPYIVFPNREIKRDNIISAYKNIWEWINKGFLKGFLNDIVYNRLIIDTIIMYLFTEKRLPKLEEISYNYEENSLLNLLNPFLLAMIQGFIIVASMIQNINIDLDRKETIKKLTESIKTHKNFLYTTIIQILMNLINNEINNAIEYIGNIKELLLIKRSYPVLYILLTNLENELKENRRPTTNTFEILAKIILYIA